MKMKMMVLILMGTLLIIKAEVPNPSYARTMLKVSRSLPGETEELKVRTAEGNVATLIVKRREKAESLQRSRLSNNGVIAQNDTVKNSENLTNSDNVTSPAPTTVDVEKIDTPTVENNEPTLFKLETNNPQNDGKRVDFDSWTPLDTDGRTLNNIDATTETYLSWKPLPPDTTKATVEEKTNYGGLLFARNFQNRDERTFNNEESARGRLTFFHHQPRPLTRTNIGANLSKNRGGKDVPPEVTIRSEINVKALPKRTPMSLDADGTPVIHGVRVPDEPIDKIQTWRNARVINNKLVSDTPASSTPEPIAATTYPENHAETQRFERFFQDVNRRYGRDFDGEPRNVFFEWDPTSHRNTALNADVYETRNENYRSNIQKRMLHPEGTQSYPNSPIYTPESQKVAPSSSSSSVKPGARAPVLQYAHPELGVQPAKILKSEKKRPDNYAEHHNSFTEQRHRKKYVLNDKNVIDSYNTKNYYPNQHFYGLKHTVEPPFWVKISENLKNQFSTGVERVSQLTKPVFDPLVEATQKISQNLGLSRGQEAQEKIGTVASGSSILIPALGLVASGAALGIGAVAVGRYLDVDVLRRSNEDQEYIQEMENQRSLHGINEAPRNFENSQVNTENSNNDRSTVQGDQGFFPVRTDQTMSSENWQRQVSVDEGKYVMQGGSRMRRRRRRSLDDLDVFNAEEDMEDLVRSKRMRRTGADSLMDIIEVDIPSRKSRSDLFLILKDNGLSSRRNDIDDSRRISRRSQRSVDSDQELEDAYQNLENAEVSEIPHVPGDWTNTPCAKRIFCDVMIQRDSDSSIIMEKKMTSLLSQIQPGVAHQVSDHFQDVMEAIRRHDCSRFLCPHARPGNVFL